MIVFSHGAKGAHDQYDRLLAPWAAAGFLVIAPKHLDHDGANAAMPVLWRTRIDDALLPFRRPDPFLAAARVAGSQPDWERIAITGHSFGGLIAQAIGGATLDPAFALAEPPPAVRGLVAFSPPGPHPGMAPPDMWSAINVPAFLEVGTRDVIPGFIPDWHQHIAGFEAGAGGGRRWLATAEGADHFFGGLICKPAPATDFSQQRSLAAVAHASADFLRAAVLSDARAAARLRRARYGAGLEVRSL